MKILFVDVGTQRIGWAFGGPDQGPTHGTYEPPATGNNLGWLMVDVGAWVTPLMVKNNISLIAYESPILVGGNSFNTIRKVAAVGAELERAAHLLGVPCEEIGASQVRKAFLGTNNTPKGTKEIKAAVIRQCHLHGWNPGTDDAADALAGWTYMIGLKCSRVSRKLGALL